MLFKTHLKTQEFAAALFAVATFAIAAPGWAGEGHGGEDHDSGFGNAGSPAEVDRTVRVEARDIAFNRAKIAAAPGETIRFIITNTGQMAHDFTLGPPSVQERHREEMRRMMQSGGMGNHNGGGHGGADGHHGGDNHRGNDGHDGNDDRHGESKGHNDPNAVMVQPGETKELIWHFKRVRDVKFGCNVPGHYQAGMKGSVVRSK